METKVLLEKTPWLYHLTDKRNLKSILEGQRILSTNALIEQSDYPDKSLLQNNRREFHQPLSVNGNEIWVRDQRPLNAALDKCLTDGWTRAQFIYLLNDRVFFWPTLKRLHIHFGRYKNEAPIILRVATMDAIDLNPHVQLCHLNSGATRPLGSLGGKAPARGPNTFVSIDAFDKGIEKLAEVTFPKVFNLPKTYWVSDNPDGKWEESSFR